MCQYNKMFSHVYVEQGVAEHPRTKQILEKLNNTTDDRPRWFRAALRQPSA